MSLFSVLLLLSSLQYVLLQNTAPGCLKDEFSCSDGKCIADDQVCNGASDCENGLDELVCIDRSQSGCPPSKLQCGDNENECIPLNSWCDGFGNCMNEEDESNCPLRPGSSCSISEFECPSLGAILTNSSQTECIPRVQRCDGNTECSNSGDELGCSPPVIVVHPQPIVVVLDGSTASFLCVAEGTPTPTITWLKNFEELDADPRYTMISRNGTGILLVKNATVFDQGQYSCMASNPVRTITANNPSELTVVDSDPFMCVDTSANNYKEGDYYYYIELQTFGEAANAAADVVFVVDESGSMIHEWIREVVPKLDEAFQSRGVGAGHRGNQFALVGFGRNTEQGKGGIILANLTSVQGFLNASQNLVTNGLVEDGYSAIDVALNGITLRNDTSRIMVFASNEGRDTLPGKGHLTRRGIENELRKRNFVLNSIVAQSLLFNSSDNGSHAFALDMNHTAYAYDPSAPSNFVQFPDGVPHPNPSLTMGSTYMDYTLLALNLEGAVFDIRQIRDANIFRDPFTNVFVDVKGIEAVGLFKRCQKCLCKAPKAQCSPVFVAVENCTGIAPPEEFLNVQVFPNNPQVTKGTNLTLTCETQVSPPNTEVSISWTKDSVDICATRAECIGDTAFIKDFMEDDKGVYVCTAVVPRRLLNIGITDVKFKVPPTANINKTDLPVDNMFVIGKPLDLFCSATGDPVPGIVWRLSGGSIEDKQFVDIDTTQTGEIVMSQLTIDPITAGNAGTYECVAINCAGSDTDTVQIQAMVTHCPLPDGTVIGSGESKVILDFGERSADVVLVVDESGSMETEHKWIVNMTEMLDRTLQRLKIGDSNSNRFGILGFGSSQEDGIRGRVLRHGEKDLVDASEIELLTQMLKTSGRQEDGYLALKLAYDEFSFRNGTIKLFILITDEERDVLDTGLNRANILNLLEEKDDSILNTVVSEGFEGAHGIPAIGIDSIGQAYVYDPLLPNFFRLLPGARPIKDSAYSTTNEDYTELALLANGSAWNLNLLRQGGPVATAFTKAFVRVTIREVYEKLSRCLRYLCLATGPTYERLIELDGIPECNITKLLMELIPDMDQPTESVDVAVSPNIQRHLGGLGDAELKCSVVEGVADITWTFNGGKLPEGVMVTTTTNSSVLRIEPVLVNHNGRYACLAKRNGEIGSDTAIIEVKELNSPLGLNVTDPEIEVAEGQNVSFTCSSNEEADFNWKFNDDFPLPTNAFFKTSEKRSVLTINDVTLLNQGRYFCIANTSLIPRGDRAFAKLYVFTPILNITVDPKKTALEEGGNVIIACTLSCFCEGATLSWRRGINGTLPDSATVTYESHPTRALLHFTDIQVEDCDSYACLGEFKGDQKQMSITQLTVKDKFKVTLSLDSNITLVEGSNLTIICSSNRKVDQWEWLFNGNSELPQGVETRPLANRTLLFVCSVQQHHHGMYECVGSRFSNDTRVEIASDTVSVDIETAIPTIKRGVMIAMTFGVPSATVKRSFFTIIESSPATESPSHPVQSSSAVSKPLSSPPTMMSTTSPTSSSPSPSSQSISVSKSSTHSIATESSSQTSSIQSPSATESSSQTSSIQSPSATESSSQTSSIQSPSATESSSQTFSIQSPSATESTSQQTSTFSTMMSTTSPTSSLASTTSISPTMSPTEPPVLDTPTVSHNELNLFPGTNDSVTCTSNIPATLVWSFDDGAMLPSNVNFYQINETSAVLEITNFDSETHQGLYRCVATAGGQEKGVIVLINPRTVLEIKLSEKEITFKPGESSTIEVNCRLTCACGGATVRWVANGRENLPDGVREDRIFSKRSSKLIFDEITLEANGSYNCIAESPDPDTEQTVDTFVLIVLEPASVAVTPSEVIVPKGESINLTCTANRGVQSFIWSYLTSEGPLPDTATFYTVSDTMSILTVSNVERGVNDGQYFCEGKFKITSDSASSTGNIIQKSDLTVSLRPPPDENNTYWFTTGSRISIECRVGCPCDGAVADWNIDTPLPNGLRRVEVSARTDRLFASSATVDMSGKYTCEVSSVVLNDEDSRQIQIVVT